ncbi:HSP20-like chaperone [Exophiala viscosa]|uniref:HSP20-like chaperone n=1 Tax=Exophiala viscosa TaxID=2486360 RepID=A0AAN6E3G8_9EURO|nr:HSP20-like chaperone [Exophiala viscosa]
MALFPRFSPSYAPYHRHEYTPFFKLFDDTFSELQKISDNAQKSFNPKFDVKEEKDKYILEGELPGIAQKDVSIEFADEQTLTIKGRTEHVREEGQKPGTGAAESQKQGDQPAQQEGGQQTQNGHSSTQVATTGGKEVGKHQPEHTYWVTERSVGEFARSFSFPNRVDQENVRASLKNGILSVVVPKLQKVNTSRKVEINDE